MKQQIVIKVAMPCDKCRSKAMSLVAKTCGVDSVSLAGEARDQVVVVGDGVDSVKLTTALRKKVGPAQLVQVADATEKKEEEKKPDATETKEEEKKQDATVTVPEYPWPYHNPPYLQPVCIVCDQRPDGACSIL